MNNTLLFDNKAELYTLYRPAYSEGFISEMVKRGILSPDKTIADVGAGTGILTGQLCDTGAKVIAIEPNDSMRRQAESCLEGKDVTIVKGTAEDIPIPDHCLDAIFVGQAFHWFNPLLFKKECLRVLVTNGYVVLVWNRKVSQKMETDRKMIINHYHHAIDSFHCSWDERIEGIDAFFDGQYEMLSFENDLVETEEEFIGRTLSASHALEKDDPEFQTYLADWKKFFQKYQKDGKIVVKNETVCFIGVLPSHEAEETCKN